MTRMFDSMLKFPVTRAKSYPHTEPDRSGLDAPIVDLDVQHFVVDASVIVGMVTLAASTTKADSDAYGQEFDLTPTEARRLGYQLLSAADSSDGGDRASFFLADPQEFIDADESDEDEVIQIVTAAVEEEDDGSVSIWMASEEPAVSLETGLRMTENDALALRAALSQSVRLVSGAKPQRFIRLLMSGLFDLGSRQIEAKK
jgi:hypothetical protein